MPYRAARKGASKKSFQKAASKNIKSAFHSAAGKKRSNKQNIAIGLSETRGKRKK